MDKRNKYNASWRREEDLATNKFPDGNFSQAATGGLRLSSLRSENSAIAAAFSSQRKQSSLLAPSPSLTLFAAVKLYPLREPFLNETDHLRFAPAESSGAAEGGSRGNSAAPSLWRLKIFSESGQTKDEKHF